MKKYLVTLCGVALAAATVAGAFGLPGGGGGSIDTTKIDEAIAAMDELSQNFETAKTKVDGCQQTVAAIAEAHGIADITSDLSKLAEIKDAITDEEKASLQEQAQAIATIPNDLQALTEAVPTVLTKVTEALTDVASQISSNPMAAASLKDKKDQLDQGKAALGQIGTDAPALIDSSKNLATTLAGIL